MGRGPQDGSRSKPAFREELHSGANRGGGRHLGFGSVVEHEFLGAGQIGVLRGCGCGVSSLDRSGIKQASREEEKPWPRVRKAKAGMPGGT